MAARFLVCLVMASVVVVGESSGEMMMYSRRLIHRFSEEVKAVRVSRGGGSVSGTWPEMKKSLEYYRMLMSSDLQRQKMKLGPHYHSLFPSQGSNTMSLGDDFGWSGPNHALPF